MGLWCLSQPKGCGALLWGKYSRESKPVASLLVLVGFTGRFAGILTNITSKFDNRRTDRM